MCLAVYTVSTIRALLRTANAGFRGDERQGTPHFRITVRFLWIETASTLF
jgi:hypothetical protein